MVHLQKNKFFQVQILEWIMLYYDIFTDTLHSEKLIIDSVLNQVYFTEGTFTDDADDFEIVKLYIFVSITSSE